MENIEHAMNYFDYGAIALIALWALTGLLRGLTREMSSLVVLAVCFLGSPHVAPIVSDLLIDNTRLTDAQVTGPVSFILAVILLALVTGLFMGLVSHIMDYGFIGKIDRIGGLCAGIIKAFAVLAAVILVSHALTSPFLKQHVLEESTIGRWGNQHLPALYNAAADRFDYIPALPSNDSRDPEAEKTKDSVPGE